MGYRAISHNAAYQTFEKRCFSGFLDPHPRSDPDRGGADGYSHPRTNFFWLDFLEMRQVRVHHEV